MKVLVAEDDPVYRRILESTLTGWGYEVTSVVDGHSALAKMEADDPPQLLLLDWVMPGLDGNQVCRAIRARDGKKYVYILMITAKSRRDDLVAGLEAGADDYLAKPFDPPELRARMQTGRRVLQLQDELIEAREAIRRQSLRDGLTGLWNHTAIMDILHRELNRCRRETRPVGVIVADLDHFKRVNDTYGHLAGDAVLRDAASRIEASGRPYDTIGRYGGEEFLIVLPGCGVPQSLGVAERLRVQVAAHPVVYGELPIPVTGSFGVAVFSGQGSV